MLNISSEMFDGKGPTDTLTMRDPCLGKLNEWLQSNLSS